MPSFGMAEKYGFPLNDLSGQAKSYRDSKECPFTTRLCKKRKGGGVCSITDGQSYPIVCPERFKQNQILYETIVEIAFGRTAKYAVLAEIPFLKSHDQDANRSAGNIDNVIVHLNDLDEIIDWCALEVQAVYFSGKEMGPEAKAFERTGTLIEPAQRRPDFRSSGPKRLLPQLEIKVPTLRRWGKKMFVAIDRPFFQWLPTIKSVEDISNADICWLSFNLDTSQTPFQLKHDQSVFATLEDSREGLVAGYAPPKHEFEIDIEKAMNAKNKNKNKVIFRGNMPSQ
ncbi:NotI family restriction endonuclease [Marinobacter sp. MIT932201]|uniref:NotI family restriction endonuclease n=1 Tax=Marinobacter sp. MIT932201 TaxID=3096995 RepID=UPI00399B270B